MLARPQSGSAALALPHKKFVRGPNLHQSLKLSIPAFNLLTTITPIHEVTGQSEPWLASELLTVGATRKC
jgi:hypothetical protein